MDELRKNETSYQKKNRIAKQKVYVTDFRENIETPDQKKDRNAKKRIYDSLPSCSNFTSWPGREDMSCGWAPIENGLQILSCCIRFSFVGSLAPSTGTNSAKLELAAVL